MEGEPLTILLAEDNRDHAELVLRTLGHHRVVNRIHHVTDGEAVLDYLQRRGKYADPAASPTPQLILLDLRLPRIDGLEVLRRIKDSTMLRRIPVVVLTTSEAEADVARAYDLHADSYLVKPLDFDKLCALIGDMGFYWLAWNRLSSG